MRESWSSTQIAYKFIYNKLRNKTTTRVYNGRVTKQVLLLCSWANNLDQNRRKFDTFLCFFNSCRIHFLCFPHHKIRPKSFLYLRSFCISVFGLDLKVTVGIRTAVPNLETAPIIVKIPLLSLLKTAEGLGAWYLSRTFYPVLLQQMYAITTASHWKF